MEKQTIEIIELRASEGMVLTNGTTCLKTVYVGANDSADNWREVPEEAEDERN